ncbi:MAG: Fe-S cluster assembly protein IscX [Arsenophonus sp.]|nr:MAG: Fe-S cluster assembly protein IscX [Arsenophonus sp.]
MKNKKEITWNDTQEIAEALHEKYPHLNPKYIRFTDLHNWICKLKNFKDNPNSSNERILESIFLKWLQEYE